MGRKKKRVIRNPRKDDDFYLKVFRHQITGHSATNISKWLDTPAVTVRRTMKKFRHIIVGHTPIVDYLIKLSAELRVGHVLLIEDFWASLVHYFYGGHGTSMQDFHECFNHCNLKKTPRQLRKERMTFLNYSRADYCFTFPLIEPSEELHSYLNKISRCRSCPMKKMQHGCHSHFIEDPQLYVDIAYHLSNFRLREPTDRELLRLYQEALVISHFQTILMKKFNLLTVETGNEEDALAQLDDFFLKVSLDLYQLMNDYKPVPAR